MVVPWAIITDIFTSSKHPIPHLCEPGVRRRVSHHCRKLRVCARRWVRATVNATPRAKGSFQFSFTLFSPSVEMVEGLVKPNRCKNPRNRDQDTDQHGHSYEECTYCRRPASVEIDWSFNFVSVNLATQLSPSIRLQLFFSGHKKRLLSV